MYFSKAVLRRGAIRDAKYADVLREGYAAHELVWELFHDGADRTRDFLYRWNVESEVPTVFTVSKRPPTNSAFFDIQQTNYAPKLKVGDLFEFTLMANTVVKRRNDDNVQTRHDVVFEYRKKTNCTDAEASLIAGRTWIERQGERFGFRVHDLGFKVNQHKTRSFQKRKGNGVTLSTLDFEGVLECLDSQKLEDALFNGIGPAKGYGCGLLMLRRLRA